MLNLYYYTQGEARQILRSLEYLIDTREQANAHIVEYFDKHKLSHKSRALPCGDYSVMIPRNEELGILKDIYLNMDKDNGILVERKNSLEELAGNLGTNRDRFENELEKMKGAEKHLVIEGGSWADIHNGRYNSLVTSQSYKGSLLAFMSRYDLHVHFTDKGTSPVLITEILKNKVKQILNIHGGKE